MSKLLSLNNIQKTISNLEDEVQAIEEEIVDINYKKRELIRRSNSISSGIKYLQKLEKDAIKLEEKKKNKGK